MILNNSHLDPVYKDVRQQSVEFGHLLANHLPMILVALDQLGAGEDQIRGYAGIYRRNNVLTDIELPNPGRINDENWGKHLGDRAFELDYRVFFVAEARRLGIDQAIAHYLHHLLPGIAGSALHALMRLAYARSIGDVDEVGVGLGYWAMTYLPLGNPGAEAFTEDPIEILVRMRDMPELREVVPPESDLLWEWMVAVSAKPCFSPLAGGLKVTSGTMGLLRSAALNLMATTMTFEAVHAVTGLHWIGMLGVEGDDLVVALRGYWTAIAAVYPKIGLPVPLDAAALESMRRLECPDWPDIKRRACASEDEHDISFTFSAWSEFSVTGDRLYQVLAARRVGLID